MKGSGACDSPSISASQDFEDVLVDLASLL